MNIVNSSKTLKCSKHPEKNIKFMQVSELKDQREKPIFYCMACIAEDLSFKSANYLSIEQIIGSEQKQIFKKWPPINNQGIINDLFNIAYTHKDGESIQKKIISFFNDFKEEFLKKIDLCQKKMINSAIEQLNDKNIIINNYSKISQIDDLRSLVLNNYVQGDNQSEEKCRQFIQQIESKKQEIEESLNNLHDQFTKNKEFFGLENPIALKEQILAHIDAIDFFCEKKEEIQSYNIHRRVKQRQSSNFTKYIHQLIGGDNIIGLF